jgi:site-specific DNA-cytosine methylase
LPVFCFNASSWIDKDDASLARLLFPCKLAATKALVRDGIKIQQIYACKNEAKTRAIAEERLKVLSAIRHEQLSAEAFAECHALLPQAIRKITRQHIEDMKKPDLIVVGFPCAHLTRPIEGL